MSHVLLSILALLAAVPLAAQDFSLNAARRTSTARRVTLSPQRLPVVVDPPKIWNEGETVTWTGVVDTPLPGSFTLAITGSIVSGALVTGAGETFEISGKPDDLVFTPLPPGGPLVCPIVPDPAATEPAAAEASLPIPREVGPASEMDILVAYSPAARTVAGGVDGILNQIRQSIAYTNQAFTNSGLSISLKLVGVQEVAFIESGSCQTDIDRLANLSDGIADEVGPLRNQLGADLVSLWISAGSCGGIANLLTNPAGSANRAFSITVNGNASAYRNLAFAHEIGHNLGAMHDRANSANPGLFPYSHGYQSTDAQPRFRDIMAYECSGAPCPFQPYFSSPNVFVFDRPIGIASPSPNSADAAATFALSAPVVEAYRPRGTVSSANLTLSPSSVVAAPFAGGQLSINVVTSGAWQASSTTPWLSLISPAAGTGNRTVTFQVAANPSVSPRLGSIVFRGPSAEQILVVNQASVSGSISPTSLSAGSAAGSGGFQLSLSSPTFAWSATVNAPGNWLSVSPASGTGSRFLNVSYTANTFGVPRTGTISIGDLVFTVTQTSGVPSLASPILTLPAAGGTSAFSLTTNPPGAPWSILPSSLNGWLSVSPESGIGAQTVTYSAAPNSYPFERRGILFLGSQQIPVRQLGVPCANSTPIALGASINATLPTPAPCGSAYRSDLIFPFPAVRYTFSATAGQTVRIVTESASLDSYLSLTGPNGELLAQDDNSGGGRNAAIPNTTSFLTLPASGAYTIEVTLGDGAPQGSGQDYTLRLLSSTPATATLSLTSRTVTASAGNGTINLTIAPSTLARTATAVSTGEWLSVTPRNGTGNGTLNYSYFANPTTTPRTATILAGGQTFTLTQEGAAPVPGAGPSTRETGPLFGAGSYQKFTFHFSHPAGFQRLGVVNILINNALDGGRACYLAYSQPAGMLFLVNDAGPDAGLSAPLTLNGGFGSISNSQCTVYQFESSVVGNGNLLTLTLRIEFHSSFSGQRVVYLAARDVDNQNSGWKTQGALAIPPYSLDFPRSGPADPATGRSARSTLSFVYQHDTLVNNLQTAWALINTAVDARNACYVAYFVPGNLLLLIPDNGDGNQATAMPLSGTGTLENSQCRISAEGSSAVLSAGQLTLNLNVTFKAPFSNNPFGFWTATQNTSARTSPWRIVGAWQVEP